MRRLLASFIILLIASPLYALDIGFLKRHGGGASSSNTTDATRGFEADSDPTGWTETDTASILNRYDTAQAHSGTHSMSVAGNDTTDAFYTYDIGSAKTSVSNAFWFYTPSSSGGDSFQYIAGYGTSTAFSATGILRIGYKKTSSKYYFQATCTANVDSSEVTTGAWYRIEVKAVQNDTSTIKIFDAAGSQVGSDVSCTGKNNAVRYVGLGKSFAGANTWGTFYFDDWGIDFTDSTQPLWTYTVEN